MELKLVKAAEAKARKILNDRETEIKDITKQINDAEEVMTKAKKEMDLATIKSDLVAYKKSKQQYSDAQISTEMYSKRLDALKNKPLIKKEEYEKLINDIFTEMQQLSDEADTRFIKLFNSAQEISEELMSAGKKANEIIKTLQSDVYKNADRLRAANGTIVDRQKEFDNHYNTCYFGKVGVEHYRYKELMEGK